MDNLGWDNPSTNLMNHDHQHLNLLSSSLELQQLQTYRSTTSSSWDRIGEMVENLTPSLNSCNESLDHYFSHQQQATATNSVGTTWADALSAQNFGTPNCAANSSSSSSEGGFRFTFENPTRQKKPRSESYGTNTDFSKEMIYRAAALRPLRNLGSVELPKRKNVRISSDPQTVAARHRRERISERLRVLQKLVPGGDKMDTASMLDEAANYLKFLKSQLSDLKTLENSTQPFT